jgi:hypothetical protein
VLTTMTFPCKYPGNTSEMGIVTGFQVWGSSLKWFHRIQIEIEYQCAELEIGLRSQLERHNRDRGQEHDRSN